MSRRARTRGDKRAPQPDFDGRGRAQRHHRRAKDGRPQHPGPDCGLHSQQEGDQAHGDPLNAYRTLL